MFTANGDITFVISTLPYFCGFPFFDKIVETCVESNSLNLVRIGWSVMRISFGILILDHPSFTVTSYIAFAFTSVKVLGKSGFRKVLIHHKYQLSIRIGIN